MNTSVEAIRAVTLAKHRYVTRQVGDDESEGVVVVCTCGDNGEAGDRAGVDAWVEHHLEEAVRAAFAGTSFEDQYGTRYLR